VKTNRESLLGTLKVASVGASLPPKMVVLEQSDCLVFKDGELIAFNDEIMVRCPSPLTFDMVVSAGDLLKILGKLPDKDVELKIKNGELVVKGKRRSAGIVVQKEVALPYTEVPGPAKFHSLGEGVTQTLKQAARTCGKDQSNPITTMVHVTPDAVEATDNFRLFRSALKTGFPGEVLIPALGLQALETVPLYKVSVNKGWVHFRTSKKKGEGAVVSVRAAMDDYPDLGPVLKMKQKEVVKLPSNLADMVERSEVMSEGADPLVHVTVEKGFLTLKQQKENGWYREQKKLPYKGTPLSFQVNPKFLVEVLQRTTTVQVGKNKMKIESDGVEFVVTLEKGE
jgi:DNA polymerase III sliding clamp (beta) subunit (PCNA family)